VAASISDAQTAFKVCKHDRCCATCTLSCKEVTYVLRAACSFVAALIAHDRALVTTACLQFL
jgi:hypothetical protein